MLCRPYLTFSIPESSVSSVWLVSLLKDVELNFLEKNTFYRQPGEMLTLYQWWVSFQRFNINTLETRPLRPSPPHKKHLQHNCHCTGRSASHASSAFCGNPPPSFQGLRVFKFSTFSQYKVISSTPTLEYEKNNRKLGNSFQCPKTWQFWANWT